MRIAIMGVGNVGGGLGTRDWLEDVGGLAYAKPLEEMVKIWLAPTERDLRRIGWALSEG
jgi:hypothetical protein